MQQPGRAAEIKAIGVGKSFGSFRALNDLTLEAEKWAQDGERRRGARPYYRQGMILDEPVQRGGSNGPPTATAGNLLQLHRADDDLTADPADAEVA